MNRVFTATVLACVFVLPGVARAEVEFDLSMGFAQLKIDGAEGAFNQQDGFRMEPRFTWDGFDFAPQLRLGVGLGISGYSHDLDSETTITIDNGNQIWIIEADQWESVSLLEPEFQISWRQKLGSGGRWFVEPGVGVGVLVANYWAGDAVWFSSSDDASEWDATWEVRPFLRAGWTGGRWVFGAETSYMWGGSVDLTDQVQGDVSEFYVGGFFGIRW